MKEKNRFLYILEAIACICVIIIHRKFTGIIGDILVVISRFAVPLFFLISGYYNYNTDKEKLKKRAVNLLKIFIIISFVYLLYKEYYMLLTNTKQIKITYQEIIALVAFNLTNFISGHLWFILALIYTYIANIFISPKCKRVFLILPIISIILFYGIQIIRPSIGGHVLTSITRNWLTIGVPFYGIGCIIKQKEEKIKISNKYLIILIILGMLLSICEFLLVKNALKVVYLGDLYIGTIIMVISLFILAVKNPNLVTCKPIENIGMKYSLIIYLIHPLYIEIVDYVFSLLKIEINDVLVLLIVFILSYLTSFLYEQFVIFIQKTNQFLLKSIERRTKKYKV